MVVHFAVVLLPFAATALIALVAVRRWRARYGVLTVAVAAVGTAAALLAKESGEWLAERDGDPGVHAVWGAWLPVLAVIHLRGKPVSSAKKLMTKPLSVMRRG